MRIERLLGMLFYILNRNKVTANELAKRFNVSKRTILRDIDTLSISGIPIYSEYGQNGGYSIHRTYKLGDRLLDVDNSKYILLALKSLSSLYTQDKVMETYEKVKHVLSSNGEKSAISIDYSVLNENEEVCSHIKLLEQTVLDKNIVSFEYTNAKFQTKQVTVEPVYVCYKWYSWYMIGFNTDTEETRLYKLARIRDLQLTDMTFQTEYDVEAVYDDVFNVKNPDNTIDLRFEFQNEIRVIVEEYFPGKISRKDENFMLCETEIREDNFMIFSILLGLGDRIRIVSPDSFKIRIKNHLIETLKNY